MKIMFPINIVVDSSNVAASLYDTYDIATPYTTGQKVYLSTNYGEYEARTNNTGMDPSLSPTDWKFLGTANRFKMFDQFLNTQTSNTGTIEVSISAYGANAIYLGNIDAISVLIEVIDNDTLTVIETMSYSTYNDVTDWLDYFYGDWLTDTKDSILYERVTLTQNISFHIIIDNGANNALCGISMFGKVREIGFTQWKVNVGALDYSTVAIDTSTGATYLQKGNYAKTLSVDIFTQTELANSVYKVLTAARGTPVVFIGGGYDLLNMYGYIQKFEELVNGPVETAITCQAIGLV
ncbi:hypothetical protein [Sulfuricurvum sp.]|uniref:hypothetical protein n=1 Tax=Sulfuricurvum sp. TaxID=2025608 RepID=UPI003BAE6797